MSNEQIYTIEIMSEPTTPKNRKIIFGGVIALYAILAVSHNYREKCLDDKLKDFSDIPSSPYYYHFQSFDTMQVVDINKTIDFSSAGDGLTRATVKDKNGQCWQITQDNGHRWHGGPTFVNVGDNVVVGTDTSRYVDPKEYVVAGLGTDTVHGVRKHIIETLTAKERAKEWLKHHKSVKNANGKLCFVTGTNRMVYNEGTALFVKCIDENGKVIIGEALNPTNHDPIANVTTGQEVIINPTSDLKGTVASIVERKRASDFRVRNLLHHHHK